MEIDLDKSPEERLKEKLENNPELRDDMEILFDYWQEKNIVNHRKFSYIIKRKVLARLKENSLEECKKVIDRYSQVYHDDSYFYDYKFPLQRLMSRGKFQTFTEEGSNWVAYDNCEVEEAKEETSIQIDSNFKEKYQEVLKQLKNMTYEKYLETEHWQHFKKKAIQNANNKCQLCGAEDTTLAVHHNNYKNRGRETFDDVIVLCEKCHQKHHNK